MFILRFLVWFQAAGDVYPPLQEHPAPGEEDFNSFPAMPGDASDSFIDRFLMAGTTFGEEFVGKAYHLLFKRQGYHVAMWQRQIVCYDIVQREACAGMSLTDKGMTRQSLPGKQFRPKIAVTYIGMGAMAVDCGCIGQIDAYVMEHGRLFKETAVKSQPGMSCGNRE